MKLIATISSCRGRSCCCFFCVCRLYGLCVCVCKCDVFCFCWALNHLSHFPGSDFCFQAFRVTAVNFLCIALFAFDFYAIIRMACAAYAQVNDRIIKDFMSHNVTRSLDRHQQQQRRQQPNVLFRHRLKAISIEN